MELIVWFSLGAITVSSTRFVWTSLIEVYRMQLESRARTQDFELAMKRFAAGTTSERDN